MELLGLDVGTKRIGIAKANTKTRIAVPDGFINVNGQEFAEIARIARLYNTSTLIVGLPRNNSGKETKQSAYVRNFARQLAMSIPNARIYFQDESLTSVEAEARLKKRKKKYEKGEIDSESATIILQDFLERIVSNGKITDTAYTPEQAKKDTAYIDDGAKHSQAIKHLPAKRKTGFVLGTAVAIISSIAIISGAVAYFWYQNNIKAVSDKNCKFKTASDEAISTEPEENTECKYIKFEIRDNDTVSKISEKLVNDRLIRSALAFKINTKITKRTGSLKTGIYSLRPTMSVDEILSQLEKGTAGTNVFNFTILPGETISDIILKLKKLGYSDEQLSKAFLKRYENDVLRGLYDRNGNLSNSAQPKRVQLEGYLFGDTYQFYKGEAPEKIISTAINSLNEVIIGNKIEEKLKAHNLTLREGVILASIVQKEARPDDMAGVAQVFLNRLRSGMSLGSDVTATYAANLDDPERKSLTSNAEVLAHDSLYNTRMHTGLTPGPISNPSITALLAVVNPDKSKSSMYYFLTGDDGKMYYSSNESGHNQNIRDYCRTLCNVSL